MTRHILDRPRKPRDSVVGANIAIDGKTTPHQATLSLQRRHRARKDELRFNRCLQAVKRAPEA